MEINSQIGLNEILSSIPDKEIFPDEWKVFFSGNCSGVAGKNPYGACKVKSHYWSRRSGGEGTG